VFRWRNIPFRCAGRTGLFMQPEASVLGKLYAWLCDNPWKNERYDHPAPVHLNELVVEFQAVFADGAKMPKLQEYLTDWKKDAQKGSAPVNLVRDYYRLLNLLGVQSLDLDDPRASSRMGCLARFSQILADYEHVKRRARYVEEDGKPVFRGGQDRGIWFYRQLFNYLQHYALDAYEDFEGEDTFDLDTVDVLTVHQAKGLEWPIVFVPCLTSHRFPSSRAGEEPNWLIPETVFSRKARRRYAGGVTEERRLFYVAMTRAKDVLYLSRFRRRTNRFRPSPFLLEVAGGDPPVVNRLPLPRKFTPPTDEADELPTVSFSEMAQYEDCPLRYRLSTSLGFQPQLVTELGYGKTIHHVLRRIADVTREKGRLPTNKEVEALFHEEFYLPFANRAAFEQLLANAKKLVKNYLSKYSDDLLRVWQTERFFELHLDGAVVNGRADVILDREGGVPNRLAIVDYKTATDAKPDDVFAFQLAIYAAAGRGEGLDVQAGYLHQLKDGTRRSMPVDDKAIHSARTRANSLLAGLISGDFPAKPEKKKCRACDVRAVCKHAICSKYDY
ncbi:MAG TPA: ATP-dependent helicase, partial [Planctomycetaceae bacterium]|nr:ATP-dependent helicase [Planctomycetaceae bacterium]